MSPELVASLARRLYGIEVPPDRAAELAAELDRLGTAAADAESALDFDDGCASHAATITAWLPDLSGDGDE